ncbi:MAG TPA: hypothetical protein VHE53_03540 [Patescibacteria group bacterium]|nr:hypothetical protein [Patescibacteria group bacterium]
MAQDDEMTQDTNLTEEEQPSGSKGGLQTDQEFENTDNDNDMSEYEE